MLNLPERSGPAAARRAGATTRTIHRAGGVRQPFVVRARRWRVEESTRFLRMPREGIVPVGSLQYETTFSGTPAAPRRPS